MADIHNDKQTAAPANLSGQPQTCGEGAGSPKGGEAAAPSAGDGAGSATEPVELAVFDFDGTSISGNSPVMLVRYLMQHDMLENTVVLRILLWAAAYKLRLPQNESWVRGLVFRAFLGMPHEQADAFMRKFYDEKVDRRFRRQADETMAAHAAAGHDVVIVSATFEPIILRAMEFHRFDHQVSTRMRIDGGGCYTCEVEGLPIEGEEKVAAIRRYADERYGRDNWELGYAYGDHHSDRALLSAAKRAFAVTPDKPLARTARRKGWEILDWD
ncbi:HAD family hydrolase [Raoultibacter timonensis]|uniref:HAD family hydrolase n=1 Tax=Raoultibacter timonensis TaxID=1907662 RepID=UPI0026DC07C7|nr:HAD-IB family hydrolase [Raoultibacter timonensis]